MKKRILSVLLCFVMIATLFASTGMVTAANYVARVGDVYFEDFQEAFNYVSMFGGELVLLDDVDLNEPVVNPGITGEGTEEDPYLIENLTQLEWFRDNVNSGYSYKGEYIKLAGDIDLSSITDWEPIGTSTNKFQGNFDGDGHIISNLTIVGALNYNEEHDNYIGLFGYINDGGYIKNVNIVNADVTGCLYVGAVVGRVYIGGVVENCHVSGNIDIEGYWYVGGIVGRYEYGAGVKNCSVIGSAENIGHIEADHDSETNADEDGSYVGGIVGFTTEPNPVVEISGNTVQYVNIYGATRTGGISGIAHQGNIFTNNTISDSNIYVTQNADIAASSSATTIGLIAGACQGVTGSPSSFSNCTATNTVVYLNGEVYEASIYGNNINGSTPVTNYVAAIGTTYYETLAAALADVQEGETVKLLSDVKLSAGISVSKAFSYTIDGNGYSISPATDASLGYSAIYLTGGADATITIENITFKDFVKTNYGGPLLRLESSKQFVLNNVTFDNCDASASANTTSAIVRWYDANFEGDALTFTDCKAGILMDIGPSSYDFVGKVVIKNSTFDGNTALGTALIYPTLLQEENSYLHVMDTVFTNNVIGDATAAAPQGRGVIHLGADAIIEGCLFDGNTVYGSHPNNISFGINEYSGHNLTYADNVFKNSAVYQTNEKIGSVAGLAMMAVGELEVIGNTVEDNNSFYHRASADAEYTELEARSVGTYSTSYGVTTITSGTYYGALVTYSTADAFAVTGGTFDTDVSDYCADGFECVANENGTYSVEEEVIVEEPVLPGKAFYIINMPKDENGLHQVGIYHGIDTLEYQEVGFELYNGNSGSLVGSYATTTVYTSIKVTQTDGSVVTMTADKIDSNYIFGITAHFSAAWDNIPVHFRAYAIDMDGNKIYGNTYAIADIYTLS